MTIGIMCFSHLGGSARVATQLARALTARGHDLHLFTRGEPMVLPSSPARLHVHQARLTSDGLATGGLYTEWPPWEYDRLIDQVLEVAARDPMDILHFHYADPFAYLAAAAKTRGCGAVQAVVGTLHGSDVFTSGVDPAKGQALRTALAAADALTTVSQAFARTCVEVFELPAPPVVIPNSVDLRQFQPHLPAASPKPVLAYVSNFRPIKDPLGAAHTFLRVRAQRPVEIWLIGDGPELAPTVDLLASTPYFDDVRVWGARPDVAQLLQRADVLLVTSRMESFCLVALEAIATGTPVVAPRVGGLSEVVTDGESGLLYEPGDETQAAAQVLQLLSDQQLHRRISAAAAHRARTFSEDIIVPRYLRLYKDVLARTAVTGPTAAGQHANPH
ncbi:glycosyltransferase [Streptomyces sp. NPDC001667]